MALCDMSYQHAESHTLPRLPFFIEICLLHWRMRATPCFGVTSSFLGATALAQALRGNSVLEQLKLSGNFIGDTGAVSIMSSLVGLTKGFLTHLWLNR